MFRPSPEEEKIRTRFQTQRGRAQLHVNTASPAPEIDRFSLDEQRNFKRMQPAGYYNQHH